MNKKWGWMLILMVSVFLYTLFSFISYFFLQYNQLLSEDQKFFSLLPLQLGFLFTTATICLLSVCLYFYMKPLKEALQLLTNIFREAKPHPLLFRLSHTNNKYLLPMRPGLIHYWKILCNPPKQKTSFTKEEPTFSNVLEQIIKQSQHFYPHLSLSTEILSDIHLPVYSQDLFQALWELIKNAHEATLSESNSNKKVSIRCFKNDEWFCCEIQDSGPGMDPKTIDQASQLYFSTKKKSTGIGLNIAESVLSRMGGIMQMDSSEEKGLCVTLFIPLDYINHVQNLKNSSRPASSLLKEQQA